VLIVQESSSRDAERNETPVGITQVLINAVIGKVLVRELSVNATTQASGLRGRYLLRRVPRLGITSGYVRYLLRNLTPILFLSEVSLV
jgi:hypothetical protein